MSAIITQQAVGLMIASLAFVLWLTLESILGIVTWALRAGSMKNLLHRQGIARAWSAWIPVLGWYAVGLLADKLPHTKISLRFFRYLLPPISAFGAVLHLLYYRQLAFLLLLEQPIRLPVFFSGFWLPALLARLVFLTATLLALHRIFAAYCGKYALLWTLLCILFPFLRGVFLYVIRDAYPENGIGLRY